MPISSHFTSRFVRALQVGVGVGVLAGLAGCARLADQPEVNPDRWAPANADRIWAPSPASASDYRVPNDLRPSPVPAPPSGQAPVHQEGQPYDLPALLDLALRENPDTRVAWESARQAAANFGAARAPYYPLVSANSANGYTRTLFPLTNGQLAQYKLWQAQPLVQMTYTLMDFGRRSASADAARQALAAANFSFDRRMQDVVFAVQRAYYALCAAKAAVVAARQNLELARSDFDAVQQRLDLGLATEPARLLARERVARSQYDVANAELMVHDAQASLAAAIGVSANPPIEVASLATQPVPTALNGQVDELIAATVRQRPDLAAKVAALRASEARVALAKAAWYPTVDLAANYGQLIWRYTFDGPPNTWANQPQYSALVTLQWDLFTGLKRLNDVRAAEAEDQATRAGVRSAEVGAIADMWRAYYEFQSSLKKYSYGQALLAAAQEAYDANIETYRQGLSTIVELLTAQRDLASARYTLIQSRADLLTSYAAVAYAAGAVQMPWAVNGRMRLWLRNQRRYNGRGVVAEKQRTESYGGGAMRIKGVSLEAAAPGVQRLYRKAAQWFGRVIIPLTAFAHCPEVAEAYWAMARALARSQGIEPRLKTLVCVRSAQIAGCPFWVDINSAVGREQGITDEQLAELASFESSVHFSALEKAILRYTEGMTRNPAEVAGPVFEELKQYFNTAQIVELTAMIAFENFRARFNRALHIESDGFCELPADHPVRKAVPVWEPSWVVHDHMHVHDEHHAHHAAAVAEAHSHMHRHAPLVHEHAHAPDAHHRHTHS